MTYWDIFHNTIMRFLSFRIVAGVSWMMYFNVALFIAAFVFIVHVIRRG